MEQKDQRTKNSNQRAKRSLNHRIKGQKCQRFNNHQPTQEQENQKILESSKIKLNSDPRTLKIL